jgi:uncharacterized small protein (DUF1192 family)
LHCAPSFSLCCNELCVYAAELARASLMSTEIERLKAQLKQDQLLKIQAVNKLAEIMNRKDLNKDVKGKKVSSADLRRKEKDCRKLQQELTQVRIIDIKNGKWHTFFIVC